VTAHLNRKERVSYAGLFECLAPSAAWTTVDDTLYLWNVDTAGMSGERREVRVIEMDCDTIQAVAFAVPKPGVFIADVELVIVLTGSVSIQLVAYVRTPEDRDRGVVGRLQPTNYNITTEGSPITSTVSTRGGRIFMASDDCTLYELDYANEHSSWPTFLGLTPPYKCRKLSHHSNWVTMGLGGGSSSGADAGVLSSVFSGLQRIGSVVSKVAGIKTIDTFSRLEVDDKRGVLYAVTECGFIAVFDLGVDAEATVSACHVSIKKELEVWARRAGAGGDEAVHQLLAKADYKCVAYAKPVSVEEGGSEVHFMVLLRSGVRIYFGLRAYGKHFQGGVRRPTDMHIVHVRGGPPPAVLQGDVAVGAGGGCGSSTEEGAKMGVVDPVMSIPGCEMVCRVETASYDKRTTVSAVGSEGGPHQLVALVEDSAMLSDHGGDDAVPEVCLRLVRNNNELGTLQGNISSIIACPVVESSLAAEMRSGEGGNTMPSHALDCFLVAEAQAQGHGDANLGRNFLCMTERGVYNLHQNSITERLQRALVDGSADVAAFAQCYGHHEATAACLSIHCLDELARPEIMPAIEEYFTRTLRSAATAPEVERGVALVLARRLRPVWNKHLSHVEVRRVGKLISLVADFKPVTDILCANRFYNDHASLHMFEYRALALARTLKELLDTNVELPWEHIEHFTFGELVGLPEARERLRLLWCWSFLQGTGADSTRILSAKTIKALSDLGKDCAEMTNCPRYPFTLEDSYLASALENFDAGKAHDGMDDLLCAATTWASPCFVRDKLRWTLAGANVVHESVLTRTCAVVVECLVGDEEDDEEEDHSGELATHLVDFCLSLVARFDAGSEDFNICVAALLRCLEQVNDDNARAMVERTLSMTTVQHVHELLCTHLYRQSMFEILLDIKPELDAFEEVEKILLRERDADRHRQYMWRHALVGKAHSFAVRESSDRRDSMDISERLRYMECVLDYVDEDDEELRSRMREMRVQHKLRERLSARVDAEERLELAKSLRSAEDLLSLAEDYGEWGCMLQLTDGSGQEGEVKNIWMRAICSSVPRSNEFHKRYGQYSSQANTAVQFDDFDAWVPELERSVRRMFADVGDEISTHQLPLAFLVKELEWCVSHSRTDKFTPHRWLMDQSVVDYWEIVESYMDYLEMMQPQPSAIVAPLILKVARILSDATRDPQFHGGRGVEVCVERMNDYIADRKIQVSLTAVDRSRLEQAETLVDELKTHPS
jgi:hypothetical protein